MSQSMYQSGQYLENNPGWHSADAPFKAGWIEAILSRNAIKPGKLVEVGCGAGQILVELARRYPESRFEGYDISPQAMEIARPKAREGLSYHHADFLTLEPSEHVDDYRGFLRALRTMATWKLFHIPLDLSVQAVLRSKGIMYAHSRLGHIHYFYKDTALSALRDCGYEVIDWNYTHAAEVMPNRALKTRLANIPRKILRVFGEDFSVRVTGGSSLMVLAR